MRRGPAPVRREPPRGAGSRAGRSRQGKERALAAARRLFIRQGYEATTVRQILDAAGMTTGSFYNFFGSKEDLLLQIASDFLEDTGRIAESAPEVIESWELTKELGDKSEAGYDTYLAWMERVYETAPFMLNGDEARVADGTFYLKKIREDGYREYAYKN